MEQISRIPITSQVEERIRELIESGKYGAGMKLPTENELCSALGVGRGSVREAFRLLQAKGLVEIKPGRGAFVAEESPNAENAVMWLVQNEADLRDFIEVRNALEPLAAKRMAERGSDTQIAALQDIHDRFLSAIRSGNSKQIAALDEAFHSAIVSGSGNSLLIDIDSRLSRGMHDFRSNTFAVEQNAKNAVEPHSRILDAIVHRNGESAQREMLYHLHLIEKDLTENIHGTY